MRSGMSLDEGRRWLQTPHVVLADVTTQHSGVIHDLALRQVLADRTVLLSQDAADIPARFGAYRAILYDFTEAGMARLRQALDQHLRDILAPTPSTPSPSGGAYTYGSGNFSAKNQLATTARMAFSRRDASGGVVRDRHRQSLTNAAISG